MTTKKEKIMKQMIILLLVAIFIAGCSLNTGYKANENEQIYSGENR